MGDEKNRNNSELSLKEKFPDWNWDYWEAQVNAISSGEE